jgi:hypothetical protein
MVLAFALIVLEFARIELAFVVMCWRLLESGWR